MCKWFNGLASVIFLAKYYTERQKVGGYLCISLKFLINFWGNEECELNVSGGGAPVKIPQVSGLSEPLAAPLPTDTPAAFAINSCYKQMYLIH